MANHRRRLLRLYNGLYNVIQNIKGCQNRNIQEANMEDKSSSQTQPEGQGFRSDLEQNFQNSENSGLGQSPVLPQTTVAPVPPVPPKKCFAGSRFY